MMNYCFEKTVGMSVVDAENRISGELKNEGFGLVSRINMKEKFKEKLEIEYRDYLILGYCNPAVAFKAIEAEDNIGLLLPCNVAIFSSGDKTVISIIRPTVAMSVVGNPALQPTAEDIESRLKAAMERV